jgi:hypothetical protein
MSVSVGGGVPGLLPAASVARVGARVCVSSAPEGAGYPALAFASSFFASEYAIDSIFASGAPCRLTSKTALR